MFKNISSKKLLIIFAVLLAAAVFFIYYDSAHEVRTFDRDIVDIDTSDVTAVSVYPKTTNHKEVRLFKEGNYWRVMLDNNKSVQADESKIKNMINQLAGIKANRVAAQDEGKWSEYKVDSSGTRVKVFEGSNNTLDITLGKYSFRQPRSMMTYVRVKGDVNVYEADGLLDFSFNQKPDYFRINTIVNDDISNWKKLIYSYPADSSFQLVKDTSGIWFTGNIKTDSAKTTGFLRTLSHLTGSDYVDIPVSGSPDYTLTIESSALGAVTISAYVDSAQIILRSSQNNESYFNGNSNSIWKKVFVGKDYFLKN